MTKVTLAPPKCTPMVCAGLMMRNHADPALIVAYLRLELQRDPTIGMTEWQRLSYRMQKATNAWARALDDIGRAFLRSIS